MIWIKVRITLTALTVDWLAKLRVAYLKVGEPVVLANARVGLRCPDRSHLHAESVVVDERL
jgi:hypothetical protein